MYCTIPGNETAHVYVAITNSIITLSKLMPPQQNRRDAVVTRSNIESKSYLLIVATIRMPGRFVATAESMVTSGLTDRPKLQMFSSNS